jgi:hypothetical protein
LIFEKFYNIEKYEKLEKIKKIENLVKNRELRENREITLVVQEWLSHIASHIELIRIIMVLLSAPPFVHKSPTLLTPPN